MNKIDINKTYSLALWWWAARWYIHIWVLKFLEEQKIEINEISWTSMWAIIWSLIAIWKNSKEIIEIAKSINILKLVDIDFNTGLIKWNKLEQKLLEIFCDIKIEDTKIPIKIIATNLETSEVKIFKSWKIISAIRASISLPWVFVPKEIEWEFCSDWWIIMNLPIDVLDWENIIASSALKINTWKITQTNTYFWMNIKTWFWKNNYEIIKRSIILMMKVNEDNSLRTINKNILLIRPDFWKLDMFDFAKIDDFIEIWYNEAKNILSILK